MNDPTAELIEAARKNNMNKLLECLHNGADPKSDDSLPLWWASKNGNQQMVELLIPISDPTAFENEALRIAFANQHKDICLMLLPYCDIQEDGINPLDVACFYSDINSVEELLSKTNHSIQIQRMELLGKPSEHIQLLKSVSEKMLLNKHIQSSTSSSTKRKL